MIRIQAKQFTTRTDLENEVRTLVSLTPDIKADYEIVGTKKEMGRLGLSHRTLFYGIRCVVTDREDKSPPTEKPQRGEMHDFGLDGQKKKLKKQNAD